MLLPFRNAQSTLSDALTSVLEQDIDLELVAVDDGSTDESAAVFERACAARDADVTCLRTEGVGIVGALELARAAARAPLLARMDGDDLCMPGRLRAQAEAFDADASLAVLGTRVEVFGAPGEGIRRYVTWQNALQGPREHALARFVESPLCHPSVMMRATALDAVGGYRDGDFPEDYELWLRFVEAGYAVDKLPMLGVRWRHLDGRLTFTDPRYRPAAFTATKAAYLGRALPDGPVRVWGAGKTGKHFVRALEPHGVRADVFYDIDPKKIGRTARGAPVEHIDAIAADDARPLLVALGARGARQSARQFLADKGISEALGRGAYICVS